MWNHWLFMFLRVASLVRARAGAAAAGRRGRGMGRGRSRESGRSRGGAAWAPRSWECCRFHVRWFFPGDRHNSTNEATKRRAGRAQRMHLWHSRKRREYGVMWGTLSTACLLVPFDTKVAS